jgi:RNA polymerase sigma factor (sigma-70 family)
MATAGFRDVLRQLQQAEETLGDAQLLAQFLASRDETAFEALVRRHGPMVLGVCRRVLRHCQDAEDAFQATFLVLASGAGTVREHESLGSWLYGVAYRTALVARAANARRRSKERQVEDMPQPEVSPPETSDWVPLLDRELEGLPEKHRAAVVLCELEGLSRKEAARQLAIPEGTLSSRLATARRLLASRLSRYGLSVTGVAVSTDLACAGVPAPLVSSTVRAAALVAAGQLAAVSSNAAFLMKGAMKTMLIQKLKMVAATAVVVMALGASGLAWRAGGVAVAQDKPQAGKPRTEVEALRREVELLRLNLAVVLEKVRSQESELRELRAQPRNVRRTAARELLPLSIRVIKTKPAAPDPVKQAEEAVRALRAARDPEARRRATEVLEKALKSLRGQASATPQGK